MHQQSVKSNVVDVFGVDFEVEDGLRAGAGKFWRDDFRFAVQSQQPLDRLRGMTNVQVQMTNVRRVGLQFIGHCTLVIGTSMPE